MLSRIENRVSRPKFRVLSFETLEEILEKTIENDLYLEFVTIEINNTALCAASFTRISYIVSTSKSLFWS